MPEAKGSIIRQRRREKGWKIPQLATRCEVSPAHIDNVEHGRKKPSIELVYRLATALGIEARDIVADPASLDIDVVDAGTAA
jgi:transcriptional regulator with XRE-family HTH domain